jgi:mycothiol synthase
MSSSLPDSRPATPDDAARVAEVMRAQEAQLGLPSDTTPAEVQDWWIRVRLETDSWLLEQEGKLVAYAWLFRRSDGTAATLGGVNPAARGRGLGGHLVELCEGAARALGFERAMSDVFAVDAAGRALFEQRGYEPVRRFYQMEIELTEPPPAPAWPEGIRAEPFRVEDAPAFHAAIEEAFADEWGFEPLPLETWKRLRVDGADTSYYFLAWDGEEIAAFLRGEPDRRGMAFVAMLGVRPAWRRRGLGQALLLHAFRAFHAGGKRRVFLGVDSENSTGATRLYERVGMHVRLEDIVYAKDLA